MIEQERSEQLEQKRDDLTHSHSIAAMLGNKDLVNHPDDFATKTRCLIDATIKNRHPELFEKPVVEEKEETTED